MNAAAQSRRFVATQPKDQRESFADPRLNGSPPSRARRGGRLVFLLSPCTTGAV